MRPADAPVLSLCAPFKMSGFR